MRVSGIQSEAAKATAAMARDVPEEQILVAVSLERERHVFRGSAEHGVGDGVGQADAERAHLGREQLGLHHAADRGVEGRDHEADHDQPEGGVGLLTSDSEESSGTAPTIASPLNRIMLFAPADPVREQAEQRLQQHEDDQRQCHHRRDRFEIELDRVDQEFLHVGRHRIEVERAAHGEGERDHSARLCCISAFSEPASSRCMVSCETDSLERAAQHHRDDGRDRTDQERNAPAPGPHLLAGKDVLKREHHSTASN